MPPHPVPPHPVPQCVLLAGACVTFAALAWSRRPIVSFSALLCAGICVVAITYDLASTNADRNSLADDVVGALLIPISAFAFAVGLAGLLRPPRRAQAAALVLTLLGLIMAGYPFVRK